MIKTCIIIIVVVVILFLVCVSVCKGGMVDGNVFCFFVFVVVVLSFVYFDCFWCYFVSDF